MPSNARKCICWRRSKDGAITIRCNDNHWRTRPWFGTTGHSMSLHTERGASMVTHNQQQVPSIEAAGFVTISPTETIGAAAVWEKIWKAGRR